ncbi:hypothetical protein ES703_113014 [subsurface metagenome]
MKTIVETIDTEVAAKYLAERDDDRPISNGHLRWLIERQKRGEWQINGDSIKFDADGKLRDGQHRLMMVMQTGIPIDVVVVRDIDPASFITMDTGKNRNLADILAIKKYPNHADLAQVLFWVRRYLVGRMTGGSKVSHEQHLATLDKHSELQESIVFYLSLAHPAGSPGWRAITMATHYLFSQIDTETANDFIERFVTGLHLEEETDPIAVLRGQVVSFATARLKPIGAQVFRVYALAWNAKRDNRPIKQSYKLRPSTPHRPKIDGFPKELFLETQVELPLYPEDDEETS